LPHTDVIVATFTYAGAPATPDPRSIYSGGELALVKTDGTTFSDGDSWKCLTCGVPAVNEAGVSGGLSFAQPFNDGKRIVAGNNIVDCSPFPLASRHCTPQHLHIYPVYWQNTADGSGPGGSISGLKLNPDNEHVGWNTILLPSATNHNLGEFAYFGRLTFDPHPTTGTPLTPRYDLTNVTGLYTSDPAFSGSFYSVDPTDPTKLTYKQQGAVGEFKNFSGNGQEIIGVANAHSDSLNHFATSLSTGQSRQLDNYLGYADPDSMSPDNNWTVTMEVRYQNRFYYISGLPGVPAITDMLPTASATFDGYNIRQRRLFEPFLEDRYGDRGDYQGQQLNDCTTGPCSTLATGPGSSANDPLWASMADSYWSPDGTEIVYWQTYPNSSNCGPAFGDPTVCPPSTEPGGRTSRIMLAKLTSRKPTHLPPVKPLADVVPWGTTYQPGSPTPLLPQIPAGNYTLDGRRFGSAAVTVLDTASRISSISVTYTNYSDDGANIINGTESVTNNGSQLGPVTFHENLTLGGANTGTKLTSEPGGYSVSQIAIAFGAYQPTGTMTTTVNGQVYTQPPSYGP
jgi:hypothetical protein